MIRTLFLAAAFVGAGLVTAQAQSAAPPVKHKKSHAEKAAPDPAKTDSAAPDLSDPTKVPAEVSNWMGHAVGDILTGMPDLPKIDEDAPPKK